jgi:23S rRNA (uracil1939-C5)-methyltransferase
MARLPDGRVGFASGVLPGERLSVDATEHKKSFVRATSFQILEPASERVNAPCAYARACGGCDWLHIDYPAQLRHKLEILREALTRTGKFERLPPLDIEPSPSPLGYRNRIRVHLQHGAVGFHARASQELVDIASCAAATPELDRSLSSFRAIVREHPAAFEAFSEAELRAAPKPLLHVVRLTPRRSAPEARRSASAFLDALGAEFAISIAGEVGSFVQRWPLTTGAELALPADAFVQVNWAVNQLMVAALVQEAAARRVASFVDLYAGAGNFTLPLLAVGCAGVAVEGSGAAARAAAQSMLEQGLAGEVLACDVLEGVERLVNAGRTFDLVILDPPRAGAAAVVPLLPRLGARHLAYCACDPVTLARDLKELRQRGFELDAIRAYDMFPGTHHFETVAWLSRPA